MRLIVLRGEGSPVEVVEKVGEAVVEAREAARKAAEKRRRAAGLMCSGQGMKGKVSHWRALVQECARLIREQGPWVFVRYGLHIYHANTGLLDVAKSAMHLGAGAVCRAVMRRCRVQLTYWSALLAKVRSKEAAVLLRPSAHCAGCWVVRPRFGLS